MTQPAFPKLLSSQIAFDIARAILDGFDKHYRLFRQASQDARGYFERGEWAVAQQAARERIGYYDRRVEECVRLLEDDYVPEDLTDQVWRESRLHYIGLLTRHKRPELAETFFNSVCCTILHRRYFNNEFIFVRPVVSTEYIETDEAAPTYRVYYPQADGLRRTLSRIVTNFQFGTPFADLARDIARVESRLAPFFAEMAPNAQFQILSSPFFRNKGAYLVGKAVNGERELPFVLPVLHADTVPGGQPGRLLLDTVLADREQVEILFSFTRAYFMVDMEVPSAYVQFLRTLLPRKPRSEIYTVLGLQKQGKTAFYRDFLQHLKHSSDLFETAPGIRGLVMLVFALPSFPYVFKVIKDFYPPPKDTTRAQVKEKYLLVKHHDRVGRMADTLEYSNVAFPRARFAEALMAELKHHAPSQVEEEGDQLIIRHLYIERRMTPLNLWLSQAEGSGNQAALEHGIVEYGNAIRDLVAANIFPGDMLYKNFGLTHHGRVVFYDYDEIEYITDCNFRAIPAARNEEDEMASEPWYPVARHDVFPEQFGQFLLGNPNIRRCFLRHHAELLTPGWWQQRKERILDGIVDDVFPYPQSIRFCHSPAPATVPPSLETMK
ncbi:bifunctional isocitrate dehydrogenase kinase/phosphatase [Pseudoduganella sp. SL102]|uniref:bifunctional isocitrate dehydrogenase kinase/phosphatase n=1 Tax=Pseudoduganella sp. SL102 TaxID=2995154 RepID=UPI00248CE27F|nr:bifunctional isocitrate dehydrogenase kinase/phosphatase [Pseudoduganella sp. SL102]WBS02896.1 bifunctional isocitrate dehydrogenase kinase/phosphatase [Pseudoduganella sp. SL102]